MSTPTLYDQVVSLYSLKMSIQYIADKYETTPSNVVNIIKHYIDEKEKENSLESTVTTHTIVEDDD